MDKRQYEKQEVDKLLMVNDNYHAFIEWYKEKESELKTTGLLDKINPISDMKRIQQEMEKYPEFFDETRKTYLNLIIKNLEGLAEKS